MNEQYYAKQQVEANASTALGGAIGVFQSAPEIHNPGPSLKASETIGYLREIESGLSILRQRLYGPFPESGQNEAKRTDEPCLDERLTDICQRAACISGEVKSILARL